MAEQEKPKAAPGPLVEDTSVVGGTDKKTGAPVIKPKLPNGKCDESMTPTDKREAPKGE